MADAIIPWDEQEFAASLDETEKSAHATIRTTLWVLYPRPDTVGDAVPLDPDEASALDEDSSASALMIMNSLRMRGFKITKDAHG